MALAGVVSASACRRAGGRAGGGGAERDKAGGRVRPRCSVIAGSSPKQQREHRLAMSLSFDCWVGRARRSSATSPTAGAQPQLGALPTPSSSHMRRKHRSAHAGRYILLHVLVRPDRHGRATQRALAPIGPYRVARARAPAALHRPMAANRFGVPRHGHGATATLQDASACGVARTGALVGGGCLRRRA